MAGRCDENCDTRTDLLRVTERAILANLLRPAVESKQAQTSNEGGPEGTEYRQEEVFRRPPFGSEEANAREVSSGQMRSFGDRNRKMSVRKKER